MNTLPSFPAIHAASDARGGTPTDQALAATREYQRQRPTLRCTADGLVDPVTGKINRPAIRRAIRRPFWLPVNRPFANADVIRAVFASVRAQRDAIPRQAAQHAADLARANAAAATLERDAQAAAATSSTQALRDALSTLQFGSKADTWNAPYMRSMFARAIEIRTTRRGSRTLMAAE